MRITAISLVIIVLVSVGCAATGTVQVKKGEELLPSSQKLIRSVDRLTYEQINLEERVNFAFDEEATVLQEGEERRFAKGFVLPKETGAYSVSITSFKRGTLRDPAIMYPEVRILDKNYRVIRTVPHAEFVFRSLRSKEGLNTVFFVNNNSQGEAFLFITNRSMDEADLVESQVNMTGSTPIVVPFPGGFAMWFIPTGSNTPPIKMKASPTGKIEVQLREYRLKKVGE